MTRSIRLMTITFIYTMIIRLIISILTPVKLFSSGIFFDAFLLVLISMLVTLIMRKAWMQKAFYMFFVFLWTMVAIADYMFYGYFSMLTTRMNAQGLTFMSFDLTVEYDLSILPAFIVLILVVAIMFIIIIKQPKKDTLKSNDYLFLVFLVFIHIMMIAHFTNNEETLSMDYFESEDYLYQTMYSNTEFASDYGYYYYHLIDLFKIEDAPLIEKTDLDAYFNNKPDHQTNDYTGQFVGDNVIQITVESFDTRFINETITPTLYMMQQSGYTFTNYYTPVVNQGATCNTEFMAITSLYATNSNASSNNVCHTYQNTTFPYSTPSQLKDAGYNTTYMHLGYEWFYQRETLMPNMGFDNAYFIEDIEADTNQNINPLLDTELTHFIDEYMTYDDPFYLHMLTYGLHGAYKPTVYDDYNVIIDTVFDDTLDEELRVYYQKLADFDAFLTTLLETLEDNNVLDDTLIVIYPDHYPFMINPDTYQTHLDIDMDDKGLYNQTMMMYHPSMTKEVITTLGSTIDIAPTLLNLVHPNPNFTYLFGHDLLSSDNNPIWLHDYSMLYNDTVYPLNEDTENRSETITSLYEDLLTHYEVSRAVLYYDYLQQISEEESE
ncbi:MAG: LTA synthase family protein [Bacillota bacterium]